MTAPEVHQSDVDDVKDWVAQQAAKAVREIDAAVRAVEAIRSWVAYERHLVADCVVPDCGDCAARTWLINRLTSLLPAVPERRAESGEEVTHERHASDEAGRPGHVTGGSETGGGLTPDP